MASPRPGGRRTTHARRRRPTMTGPTERRTRPLWQRPRVVGGVVAVALVAAIAATTTTVSASDPAAKAAASGGSTFDAKEYATEHYDSEVVPTIQKNAV